MKQALTLVIFFYLDKVELDNIKYSTGYDWQTTFGGPKISSYYVLDAGWERSKKLDVGLEMTLFPSLEYYGRLFLRKRSNILMQRKHGQVNWDIVPHLGVMSGR